MGTYYITLRGKRTSVTIDDTLACYMVAKLKPIFPLPGFGRDALRRWLKSRIKREGDNIPETNVSQWFQARILREIVAPELLHATVSLVREDSQTAQTIAALKESHGI